MRGDPGGEGALSHRLGSPGWLSREVSRRVAPVDLGGRVVDVLWPDSTPGLEHDVGSIGPMKRLGGSTRIEPGGKR